MRLPYGYRVRKSRERAEANRERVRPLTEAAMLRLDSEFYFAFNKATAPHRPEWGCSDQERVEAEAKVREAGNVVIVWGAL